MKAARSVGFLFLSLGILLLILGFIGTPTFVANHLSHNGTLEKSTIQEIQALRLSAACVGAFAIIFAISLLIYPTGIIRFLNSLSLIIGRLRAKRYWLPFCFICFAIAMTFGLLVTQSGPGISPDSVDYISTGESIYHGQGFPKDYSHYPLYPLLIAGFMYLGFDAELAARLIPVLCFALLVFPVFLLGKKIGGIFVGSVACLGCLISLPLLRVTSMAWTDMPLVLLVALSILFLVRFTTSNGAGTKLLCTSAVFTAAAMLMNFGGAVLLVIGMIAIVVKNKSRVRMSAIQFMLFISISCLPLVPWLIRNMLVTSRLTAGFVLHDSNQPLIIISAIQWIALIILPYILPYQLSRHLIDTYQEFGFDFHHLLFIVAALVIIIFFLWVISMICVVIQIMRRLAFSIYCKRNFILIMYIFVHLLSLIMVGAIWKIAHEERYLSVIYPFITLAVVSFIFYAYRTIKDSSLKVPLFLVIVLSFIFIFGLQSIYSLTFYQTAKNGQDFNSEFWRNSKAIVWVEHNLVDNAPVYSNNVLGIELRIENPTRWLPSSKDEQGIETFFETVRNEANALVIGFKENNCLGVSMCNETMTNEEIVASNIKYEILTVVADFPEATIWAVRPQISQ